MQLDEFEVLNVFWEHSVHSAELSALCVPAWQLVQDYAFSPLNVPPLQEEQADPFINYPDEQFTSFFTQADELVELEGEVEPDGQDVQEDAFTELYVPSPHS